MSVKYVYLSPNLSLPSSMICSDVNFAFSVCCSLLHSGHPVFDDKCSCGVILNFPCIGQIISIGIIAFTYLETE